MEVRRKRIKIRQILSVLKSTKNATPPASIVVEVQGPLKKVDIFAVLGKEKKKELDEFIQMKVQKEYTMHSFAAKDFSNMTNMRVWYEDNVSLLLLTYPSNLLHEEESTQQMCNLLQQLGILLQHNTHLLHKLRWLGNL